MCQPADSAQFTSSDCGAAFMATLFMDSLSTWSAVKNHRTVRLLTLALATLSLTAMSCSCRHNDTTTPVTNLYDAQEMEKVLLTQIPIGTRLSDARRFMEHEGFSCTARSKPVNSSNAVDCLDCLRVSSDSQFSLVSRVWNVEILTCRDAVTAINASTHLDGP